MQLRVGSFPFPFRSRFEHASAARSQAANVIVLAEDGSGLFGLGEGCPRAYVTGETIDTAVAAIAGWCRAGIEHLEDRGSLEAWSAAHAGEIDAHPSAFAAVELALLDLYARREGQCLEQFLGVAEQGPALGTTAVYGTGSAAKFVAQMVLFNAYGMHEAKLKLVDERARNVRRARWLARCGRLRLDANNLWSSADIAHAELDALSRWAWAVEEPLQARDWSGFAAVGTRSGLAIVLDESVTRAADLACLVPGPRYVLNARVSKHGGLLRTLAVIDRARRLGVSIVVGAQVGETSILARAGVVAARAAGDALVGFECAFGTRLLSRDAVRIPINFGRRGKLDLSGLGPAGSGLVPTAEVYAGCSRVAERR